jgi:hypothetical protein
VLNARWIGKMDEANPIIIIAEIASINVTGSIWKIGNQPFGITLSKNATIGKVSK